MSAYLRAALCVAAMTMLVVAATFINAHAAPSPAIDASRLCIPADMVKANLTAGSESVDALAGVEAQQLSDAIAAQFGSPVITIASFAAYIRGDVVRAFGFDDRGCAVASGEMALKVYQAARAAAFGLSL